MSEIEKALDDLGGLIDQLASNAREFDYHTANRMERDAAKALLTIEAAVNALPELLAKVKRYEAALNLVQENVEASASSYQVRVETISRVVRAVLKETGQ